MIGAAAELVSDPLGVTLDAAIEPEDLFYAGHFLVRPRSGKGDAVDLVLSVLNGALSPRRVEGGSPLARDGGVTEATDRFHGVHWETFEHGTRWAGELTWIHPHAAVTGVPCTTHVALSEQGREVALTVHVGARGGVRAVRGLVGAGQARPALLPELSRLALLSFEGRTPEPRTLEDSEIDGFVRNVLLSERRKHPVAVLAPTEPLDHTEPPTYLVPPEQLADELLGLAHVYVLARHPTTFRLSDALGDRRLSCYWGAMRVYLPGFSCADSAMQHPLLGREKIEDPVMRAELVGTLGREATRRLALPRPVAELREAAEPASEPVAESAEPSPVESASPAAPATPDDAGPAIAQPPGETAGTSAVVASALADVFREIVASLADKLDELVHLNAELVDEVARLRTATVVRTANTAGVERRLGQFERLLREHFTPGPEGGRAAPDRTDEEERADEQEEDSGLSLVSVVQHAESEYADAMLVLESAIASAASSPYEDVHRVAVYLKEMAGIARRRQDGRLKMSLRDAFGEAGMEYRGHIATSTSKKQRQQYLATLPDGGTVECHEHVVLGSSYDPRYCLRIYFTSRAPQEPRFVIAHVGRHFDVMTTN
jgi:hypothetical protein